MSGFESVQELAASIIDSLGKAEGNGGSAGVQNAAYILPYKRSSVFDRQFEAQKKKAKILMHWPIALRTENHRPGTNLPKSSKRRILASRPFHFTKKLSRICSKDSTIRKPATAAMCVGNGRTR
jgi:hypothetical protein